ncbi:MAG: class I SAM-dependent methyltransferase [Actinomycetota bacterium]|nr:class I SAM-dependent methyltransferase [Actinomycetota bacterium]MDQ2980769.1 class I SAM-dependent methyltransferase [Actinomycetota bacterium]
MENAPVPVESDQLPFLATSDWQMSFGERAAVEGVLYQSRPSLAIELGTAQGGSLERIAAHSDEVHTFDLIESPVDRSRFPNVQFHVGDSHQLLPQLLNELAGGGRNVDFVLVDGDHSANGVRRDILDLLESPALGRSLILLHDTANEVVRAGIEAVSFGAYPKVAYVELDFVAGYLFRQPSLLHELWGGLGLVVVDASRLAYFAPAVRQQRYYELGKLMPALRDLVVEQEAAVGREHVS